MKQWGVMPFVAAALLGGVGTHTSATHVTTARTASIVSATADPTPPISIPAGAPAPALRQEAGSRWTATVLVNDASPRCAKARSAHYWLEASPPDLEAPYTAIHGTVIYVGADAGASVATVGSSCELTVAFTVPDVPETAALVVDQAGASASIPLTVSRNVTLWEYLWIPAVTGGAMASVTLVLSLLLIRFYNTSGKQGHVPSWRDLWRRPIIAAGAWTATDSWATNISTLVAVIATVLAATSALNSLFPGISLDRFAIANAIAGGFVLLSPLAFGIGYSWWTARNPGITANATIRVPLTARLDASTQVSLRAGAQVKRRRLGRKVRLSADARAELSDSTQVMLAAVTVGSDTGVTLPRGTLATLPARTWVLEIPDRDGPKRVGETLASLPEETHADLPTGTALGLAGANPAILPWGGVASVRDNTKLSLPGGVTGHVAPGTKLKLAPGTVLALTAERHQERSPGNPLTFINKVAVTLVEADASATGLPEGPTTVTVQPESQAELAPGTTAWLNPSDAGPAVFTLPSGAGLTVFADATVSWTEGQVKYALTVAAGKTIDIPGGSTVAIPAGAAMVLPGDTNISLHPGTAISVSSGSAGTADQAGGELAISTGDVVSVPSGRKSSSSGGPAPDLRVPYPAVISTPGGAKISVVGTAGLSLPRNSQITAPNRAASRLPFRRQLQLPQGSDVITANLALVLLAAVVTMFGIGAEIGIAAVLAYFSDASAGWTSVIFAAIAVTAVLVLSYAATATRTLADPQPGSSLSSTPGTSFTL